MMSGSVSRRATRFLVVALAALAAVLLPLTPAHAAYGPQNPVQLQLFDNFGTRVGSVDGWMQFDDGNTLYRYSLTLCRQSSFTEPFMSILVNGGSRVNQIVPSWTTSPACGGGFTGTITAETNFGGIVGNATFILNGSSFNGMTFKPVSKSVTFDNPYN